jgi:hypothetical protein
MISSEVQRTLVKSPPELWSELSDPAALARHLGELGEIRIVRVEPEKTVEWAAENTTGTVSIQSSGWGTKVTLSVTRELVAPAEDAKSQAIDMPATDPDATETGTEAAAAAAAPEPDPELVEDTTAETEPELVEDVAAEPELEAETAIESEPTALESEPVDVEPLSPQPFAAPSPSPTPEPDPKPEPTPRRGFFARLFGRRRRSEIVESEADKLDACAEPQVDAFAAVSDVLAREAIESNVFAMPTGPTTASEPAARSDAAEPQQTQAPEAQETGTDIAAELMAAEEVAAEEVAAEEVTAVLAAVLDRLGAAHHRPFSRS